MTINSTNSDKIELNDDELSHVVGGNGTPVLVDPRFIDAKGLSAIQPIHLAPLPPLHTALPHF